MKSRRWAFVLGTAALVVGAGAAVGGRAVCRSSDFFRVRQVEVRGAAHLSVDTVLAALALDSAASICDNLDETVARLTALPGVAGVRVGRRWPGTVEVRVIEVPAVAFVRGASGLRVVDAAGQTLPYDPVQAPLDLPIAASGDTVLLGAIARVASADPTLARQITEARRVHDAAVLDLGSTLVLLGPDASSEVIRAVALVAADLDARGRGYSELDARFAGQVVVRGGRR